MARQKLVAVGYCARMSEVGDWAFQFALDLARRHDAKLDIFVFPTAPCTGHETRGRRGEMFRISEEEEIDLERRVRFYYEEHLGDFVEAGFRICLGDETPELRSCLFQREFDILVLAYEHRYCPFGNRSIEEFADRLPCPVVLVGPDRPDEFHLNHPAKLWLTELGLEDAPWNPIGSARG